MSLPTVLPASPRGARRRLRRLPAWDAATRVSLGPPELQAAIEIASGSIGRAVAPYEVPPPAADAPARLAWRLAWDDPHDPRLDGLLGILRSRMVDGALHHRSGAVDLLSTATVGQAEAAWRDASAWDRCLACARALLDGEAHGPAQAASFLGLVSGILAQETPEAILVLPLLPDDWFGEDISILGLPLPGGGRLTVALAWDDEWPRLDWLCTRADVVLQVPCLLPGWRGRGPRGSSLLAPGVTNVSG